MPLQIESQARELMPGIFWLGGCLEQLHQGRLMHSYNACFLVQGENASLLVDTGHPKDYALIRTQLQALEAPEAPLRHIFLTHQETPHSGNLRRLAAAYPQATVHGEISDYALAVPGIAERLRPALAGDSIDLGNRVFRVLESVVRDLRTSLWGLDEQQRVLFPADGFAYGHYHNRGHCGKLAEETMDLDITEGAAVFAERALFWTKFSDVEPYIDRLRSLIERHRVAFVAPSHGLPISNLALTMPQVEAGLRDQDDDDASAV